MSVPIIKTFYNACSHCKLKQAFAEVVCRDRLTEPLSKLTKDTFEAAPKPLRERLIAIRDAYLKTDNEAFLTVEHVKDSYDNYTYVLPSVKGQTKELNAVSTEDFSNLSEIMKKIRTPEEMTVYRAMEGGNFNIGRITPEEFFREYYKEGKTVTVPIYMSTSLDKNIAYRFAKDNPYRFMIKLKVPKDTPAIYMENLVPCDVHGAEDELNIIRNSMLRFGKVTKKTNPLDGKPIYELEGTILGYKDVPVAPRPEFQPDPEMFELLNALKTHNA